MAFRGRGRRKRTKYKLEVCGVVVERQRQLALSGHGVVVGVFETRGGVDTEYDREYPTMHE